MTTATDLRRRELGQIHQAKAALGLDDETYRVMLENLTGKRSAGDLDWKGRKKVLDHLHAKGAKPTRQARPVAPDKAPLVKKIRAQLINHPTGRKTDEYADGMAKQMFGVDKFTWCNDEQLGAIVKSLAVDARRRGK